MAWSSFINGFKAYLMLEKGLSAHSIEAYLSDINKLKAWAQTDVKSLSPLQLKYHHLEEFIVWLNSMGLGARTQARIISGIKSFFKYLRLEDLIEEDPAELIESPKIRRHLPDVLSVQEVDRVLNAVDLSHPQGHRNRAILEILYACGLRVSELVSLKISNFYADMGLIKVIGKNNKERLIPIGKSALKYIDIYLNSLRKNQHPVTKGDEDILFLNRRGGRLSRIMIFNIVRETSAAAEIKKKVSPHTFRHSFATHLVEGGADLKAVQDMLGHESITTTEVYTHLDTHYLRQTILNYHPRNRDKSLESNS